MKKLAIGIAAVLAMSGSAFAYDWEMKDNTSYDQGNLVGRHNAQITHNGAVTGGHGAPEMDQTTAPGTRGDIVQGVQASQGRGRANSNSGANANNGGGKDN